ncbi:hypothetical protein [Streptomyces sp. NPDC005907]|uniref:hypothetical protein n=1 Tax=Streptomyces sp. NPDC005907 TaxID=3154571 RepID=UPI0033F143F6
MAVNTRNSGAPTEGVRAARTSLALYESLLTDSPAEGVAALVGQVHRLGREATALYEQVARVLPEQAEGLERMEEQYRRALDLLGEPA